MLSRKVVRIIGNILIGRKIEEAHTVVREKKMIFINDDFLRFGHIIFISCNTIFKYSSQNFVQIVLFLDSVSSHNLSYIYYQWGRNEIF